MREQMEALAFTNIFVNRIKEAFFRAFVIYKKNFYEKDFD